MRFTGFAEHRRKAVTGSGIVEADAQRVGAGGEVGRQEDGVAIDNRFVRLPGCGGAITLHGEIIALGCGPAIGTNEMDEDFVGAVGGILPLPVKSQFQLSARCLFPARS